MKKEFIKAIIKCVLISLFFISCTKSNTSFDDIKNDAKNAISASSKENQVKYAEENLKQIGEDVAKLTNESGFIEFIHNEVNKKFDGEYEVLIKDLKKNSTWSNNLNTLKINAGLEAFKDIRNESFYPHIYIPKFQYDEENNILSRYSVDSILFVFYGGDLSSSDINASHDAYYLNDKDSLVYWGLVNETYANQHEVWIFALNDKVGFDGRNAPVESGPDAGGGGGGGGTTTSNTIEDGLNINYRLNKLTVKLYKESWLGGDSEVHMRAWANCRNGRVNGNLLLGLQDYSTNVSTTDFLGCLIKNVKTRDIRNQKEFVVNLTLNSNWTVNDFNTKPIIFQYVIFERDLWPTGTVTQVHNPYSGTSDTQNLQAFFTFRSADDEYIISSFYANKAGVISTSPSLNDKVYNSNGFMTTYNVNNDGIKFNVVNY